MITQNDFHKNRAGYDAVREAVILLAEDYINKYGQRHRNIYEDITSVEIEDDNIEIATNTWIPNGGGTETDNYTLPISYLWTMWMVTEDTKRQAAEVERLEEKARLEQARLDMAKATRKAEYKKLKKEFESDDG